MDYNRIISVTGMPGLFELVSSRKDGAVVKSLADGVTKFVSSRIHNFSHLESIEIFTTTDNVNLVELFTAIGKNEASVPDDKDENAAIKKYFETIYPTIDAERVHNSDMRKMLKWYRILKDKNIEIKLSEEPQQEGVKEAVIEKAKKTETKAAVVKNAPAKKINSPRKMA